FADSGHNTTQGNQRHFPKKSGVMATLGGTEIGYRSDKRAIASAELSINSFVSKRLLFDRPI
ncbi:MAG: hypothetical protein ACPGYL_07235, partial [Rhodospirillaceae bacterium]